MIDAMSLGSLTLEHLCTLCKARVWKDAGSWQCECYSVPEYEMQIGAADIPDFWVDVSDCTHEWGEVYYGVECKHCKLFYPNGSAPWLPGKGEVEQEGVAETSE